MFTVLENVVSGKSRLTLDMQFCRYAKILKTNYRKFLGLPTTLKYTLRFRSTGGKAAMKFDRKYQSSQVSGFACYCPLREDDY